MVYLKQNEMCNPSQTFGLENNKRAAFGLDSTRYHSTNEEEIIIPYIDFSKNHPVKTGQLSYGFLYVQF
jgi:hypothetical protein